MKNHSLTCEVTLLPNLATSLGHDLSRGIAHAIIVAIVTARQVALKMKGNETKDENNVIEIHEEMMTMKPLIIER